MFCLGRDNMVRYVLQALQPTFFAVWCGWRPSAIIFTLSGLQISVARRSVGYFASTWIMSSTETSSLSLVTSKALLCGGSHVAYGYITAKYLQMQATLWSYPCDTPLPDCNNYILQSGVKYYIWLLFEIFKILLEHIIKPYQIIKSSIVYGEI